MIQFAIGGDVTAAQLQKKLDSLGAQARPVVKRAVNATAKDARKLLLKKAQETYVIKAAGFNKGTKIKNASNSNLEATINVTGKANELKSFKVSPASYKTGSNRPDVIRGKVIQKNSLKKLANGSTKAFIVKFAAGKDKSHTTVAERVGPNRFPLKVLYSPSNPAMVGSKQAYGVVKPKIGKMLQEEISKQIDKQLRKGAGA